MNKLFLDTNVILDYVARRENCEYMDMVIQFSLDQGDMLCTSLLSFANMAYITFLPTPSNSTVTL